MDPHAPPSLLSSVRRLLSDERRRQATDRDLLQAFVQRNESDAFAELLRRHGPMVLHLALHLLHHRQDAEDVYQATFLTLARQAASLRCESSVAAWLHRVAWRLALRSRAAKRRAAGVRGLVAIHQPADADRSPGPAEEISLRESQEILHQELAALPEHLRSPLVLCYLQGRTRDEAARRLGWSLGTLIRRLEQGRKRLHGRLSRRGVTLPALLAATLFAAAEVPASLSASTLGLATSSLAGSVSVPASVAALMAQASWSAKAKAIWGLVLMLGACAGAGAWAYCGQRSEPVPVTEAPPLSSPPAAVKCEIPSEPANDRFGDPLPAGALVRLGTVRMRHAHLISGVAFSPDGKSIIASDYYSGVHVWDAAEGKEIRRFYKDEYYCPGLALSSDGRTLAVALGDGSIRLCDPSSGRELGSLPKEVNARLGVFVFSNNGSLLATVYGDKTVRIWDVATTRLVRKLTFAAYVQSVAFSSDGKLLACSTSDGHCRLWDLSQGKEIRQLRNTGGQDSLYAIFASQGGPPAVWGYEDRSIRLFDASGVKEIRRIKAEGVENLKRPHPPWGWVDSVRFSPNGKILAIFRQGISRIEIWDVESGKMLHELDCGSSHIPSFLRFSPDGSKLASAGGDQWLTNTVIRLWDVTQGKEVLPLAGHSSTISWVAISPDGKTVATAGQDGLVHLWDRSSGRHLLQLEGYRDRWPRVSFSSDGQRVIGWGTYNRKGEMHIWDAKTGQEVNRLVLHNPEEYWVTVSNSGMMALTVNWKEKLRFYDLATGKMVCAEGNAKNAADRKELLRAGNNIGGHRDRLPRLSADGRRRVDAAVREELGKMVMSDPPAEDIQVFDPIEGKELRRFAMKVGAELYEIDSFALSRDGKMVITSLRKRGKRDEQILALWETETGRERGHFVGSRGGARSLAISSDGRFIVSGGYDTAALVWDATRPQMQKSYGCACPPSAGVDVAAHFKNLAGQDAEQAYASMWALINDPKKAVSFLGRQSVLFARTDVRAIQGWIGDLDSDAFAERDRASRQLGLILDEAESHLKKALQGKPSLELRRRIDQLLEVRSTGPTERELQRLRVIEILEHIAAEGTDATRLAAIAVLKKLAAAPIRTAQEAKASLARLEE